MPRERNHRMAASADDGSRASASTLICQEGLQPPLGDPRLLIARSRFGKRQRPPCRFAGGVRRFTGNAAAPPAVRTALPAAATVPSLRTALRRAATVGSIRAEPTIAATQIVRIVAARADSEPTARPAGLTGHHPTLAAVAALPAPAMVVVMVVMVMVSGERRVGGAEQADEHAGRHEPRGASSRPRRRQLLRDPIEPATVHCPALGCSAASDAGRGIARAQAINLIPPKATIIPAPRSMPTSVPGLSRHRRRPEKPLDGDDRVDRAAASDRHRLMKMT
jgi:hypothetical protein